MLAILAIIAMVGSAVYWWGVQSTLIPNNKIVAIAFTAILVLAPPSLVSFLIPWSPGGMLLQKVNAKTWGYAVVI
ncbi:histidine kinase, partial [Kouleothrix aurantiaca]